MLTVPLPFTKPLFCLHSPRAVQPAAGRHHRRHRRRRGRPHHRLHRLHHRQTEGERGGGGEGIRAEAGGL